MGEDIFREAWEERGAEAKRRAGPLRLRMDLGAALPAHRLAHRSARRLVLPGAQALARGSVCFAWEAYRGKGGWQNGGHVQKGFLKRAGGDHLSFWCGSAFLRQKDSRRFGGGNPKSGLGMSPGPGPLEAARVPEEMHLEVSKWLEK